MHAFRSPQHLARHLANHGAKPSPMLDALCAQKDAHTSLLYWFTDLAAARAEAQRTGRPILSLRLLGRLDEELSCANSRFFRKLLYPEPMINHLLRTRFVLHWQSVRPVPIVTIDFGDGRRVERTLTGNSVHLVLDRDGEPADALPGLFAPSTFYELLDRAHAIASAPLRKRAALHRKALANPPSPPAVRPSRALNASVIAATKHVVEAPLLRAVSQDVANDTTTNLALHARIQRAFADGARWSSLDALVDRIYSDLFEMPLDDAALGLDVPDPFSPSDIPLHART